MAGLFEIYWYRELPAVACAFLYNLRDDDLTPGGQIRKGEIIAGKCGYHVAQADVPGYSGRVVAFRPNRHCEWQGFTLPSMTLDGLPVGRVPRGPEGKLRHRHCVVAEVTSTDAASKAAAMGLPIVISAKGKKLVNLEVASIPSQGRERRAQLL
jgi:hypothetical protein